MTNNKFKHYYHTPTKVEQPGLDYAKLLFCISSCHNQCVEPYLTHNTPNILRIEYTIQNHHIHPRIQEHANHPLLPPHQRHPKAPLYILKNPTQFPIHTKYMVARANPQTSTKLQNTYILLMPMDASKRNNLQQVATTKRPLSLE